MTIYINKTQDNINSTPLDCTIREWSIVRQIIKSYPNSCIWLPPPTCRELFGGGGDMHFCYCLTKTFFPSTKYMPDWIVPLTRRPLRS